MSIQKRLYLPFFTLISTLMFSSCVLEHNSSQSDSHVSQLSSYPLDYENYQSRIITLDQFFRINKGEYFIYVFSRTCSPCNNIKETILQLAKEIPILYFLEYTRDIKVMSKQMNLLIGTCDVNKIYINGTPSLFKIENNKISAAMSGKTTIVEYLIEESVK